MTDSGLATATSRVPDATPMAWSEFLTSVAPGRVVPVTDVAEMGYRNWTVLAPPIQLHCDSEWCNGVQTSTVRTTVVARRVRWL